MVSDALLMADPFDRLSKGDPEGHRYTAMATQFGAFGLLKMLYQLPDRTASLFPSCTTLSLETCTDSFSGKT